MTERMKRGFEKEGAGGGAGGASTDLLSAALALEVLLVHGCRHPLCVLAWCSVVASGFRHFDFGASAWHFGFIS